MPGKQGLQSRTPSLPAPLTQGGAIHFWNPGSFLAFLKANLVSPVHSIIKQLFIIFPQGHGLLFLKMYFFFFLWIFYMRGRPRIAFWNRWMKSPFPTPRICPGHKHAGQVLWVEVPLRKLSWVSCPVSTAPPCVCHQKRLTDLDMILLFNKD